MNNYLLIVILILIIIFNLNLRENFDNNDLNKYVNLIKNDIIKLKKVIKNFKNRMDNINANKAKKQNTAKNVTNVTYKSHDAVKSMVRSGGLN
jgi:hypothetical protein